MAEVIYQRLAERGLRQEIAGGEGPVVLVGAIGRLVSIPADTEEPAGVERGVVRLIASLRDQRDGDDSTGAGGGRDAARFAAEPRFQGEVDRLSGGAFPRTSPAHKSAESTTGEINNCDGNVAGSFSEHNSINVRPNVPTLSQGRACVADSRVSCLRLMLRGMLAMTGVALCSGAAAEAPIAPVARAGGR